MIIRILICFGLGAIPFSVLAMSGTGVDIRKVGSGNPGFNNVLRISKSRAVWALLGDTGKGVLALVLVWILFPPAVRGGAAHSLAAGRANQVVLEGWIFGFAAILGHCFSPFLKFRGGKGIATSGGVMLVLYPLDAVMALAYFVAARLVGRRLKWPEAGAVASLSSWILFVLLIVSFRHEVDAVPAALVAAFLFWTHRENLRRLFENKQKVPARRYE